MATPPVSAGLRGKYRNRKADLLRALAQLGDELETGVVNALLACRALTKTLQAVVDQREPSRPPATVQAKRKKKPKYHPARSVWTVGHGQTRKVGSHRGS